MTIGLGEHELSLEGSSVGRTVMTVSEESLESDDLFTMNSQGMARMKQGQQRKKKKLTLVEEKSLVHRVDPKLSEYENDQHFHERKIKLIEALKRCEPYAEAVKKERLKRPKTALQISIEANYRDFGRVGASDFSKISSRNYRDRWQKTKSVQGPAARRALLLAKKKDDILAHTDLAASTKEKIRHPSSTYVDDFTRRQQVALESGTVTTTASSTTNATSTINSSSEEPATDSEHDTLKKKQKTAPHTMGIHNRTLEPRVDYSFVHYNLAQKPFPGPPSTLTLEDKPAGPASQRQKERAQEIRRKAIQQLASRHETSLDDKPKSGTIQALIAQKRLDEARTYYNMHVLTERKRGHTTFESDPNLPLMSPDPNSYKERKRQFLLARNIRNRAKLNFHGHLLPSQKKSDLRRRLATFMNTSKCFYRYLKHTSKHSIVKLRRRTSELTVSANRLLQRQHFNDHTHQKKKSFNSKIKDVSTALSLRLPGRKSHCHDDSSSSQPEMNPKEVTTILQTTDHSGGAMSPKLDETKSCHKKKKKRRRHKGASVQPVAEKEYSMKGIHPSKEGGRRQHPGILVSHPLSPLREEAKEEGKTVWYLRSKFRSIVIAVIALRQRVLLRKIRRVACSDFQTSMTWEERDKYLKDLARERKLTNRIKWCGKCLLSLVPRPKRVRKEAFNIYHKIYAPKPLLRATLWTIQTLETSRQCTILAYVGLHYLTAQIKQYIAVRYFKKPRYSFNDLISAVVEGRAEAIPFIIHDKWAGLKANTETADGTSMLLLAMQTALDIDGRLRDRLRKDYKKSRIKPCDAYISLKRRRSNLGRRDRINRFMKKGLIDYDNLNAIDLFIQAEAQTRVLKTLLRHGANINTQPLPHKHDGDCWGLLHHAVAHDNVDRCRWITDRGAIVDLASSWGRTPIMIAAKNSASNALQHLLELSANVARSDKDGWTALHFAADAGANDCTALLLRAGAPKEARTIDNLKTPMDLAMERGHNTTYWLITLYNEKEIPVTELFDVIEEKKRARGEGLKSPTF